LFGGEVEAAFLWHRAEAVDLGQLAAKDSFVEAERVLGLAVEVEVGVDTNVFVLRVLG
jgi:hypothetical protein